MKFKKIGPKIEQIPVIGQGTMGIGGYLSTDSRNDNDCIRVLQYGIDLGMTFIDTAEVYGNGHSEELVGMAIRGKRLEIFLATKFSPEHNFYSDVKLSCENSLKRLDTDYIDLYQIHWPNPSIPISETMRAMRELLKEGKVRQIGVSNLSLSQTQEVLNGGEIFSTQVEYNLLDRQIEDDLLPFCQDNGMALIAYSPLDQGRFKNYKKIAELKRIARKYGKTVSQVILQWLVAHQNVIAIPKALKKEHVLENAVAADFKLSSDDYKYIEKEFLNRPLQIEVGQIIVKSGLNNRQAYQTLEDAIENKLHFVPSPIDLAEYIRNHPGEPIKPIRVKESGDDISRYDLIEGRVRYWAWHIAFNGLKPIPSYVL